MGRITDGAQKPRPMIIKFRNQGIKNLELENSLIAALITVIAPLHRKKGLTSFLAREILGPCGKF